LKFLYILFIPFISAWAIDLPDGYEIISKDSNRIEIKDLTTGFITPHWIIESDTSLPEITSEDQIRPWYYFATVANLQWYALVVGADLNHSGNAEIYGWANGVTYLDTLINELNFEHINFGRIGGPDYWGDTDGDSLLELLVDDDTTMALYESMDYHSYPSTNRIWSRYEDCMCPLEAKIGDLDRDGFQEILYYNGQRADGYQVYEYDGTDSYNWKTAIRFFDHVLDYTGEPCWGDIDSDGRTEIVAGGIHGEVIMYECVADDSFEFVWQDSAGGPDAYSTEYLGDTDGDGRNEFMIASSSIWAGQIGFSIFEATGDNQFELVSRFGIDRYTFSDGDMVTGDFTGEGYDEIALCTGRNITIIRAFGDNDWRQIARYRNSQLDLEIYGYRINENHNSNLLNLIRVPNSTWFTRILKLDNFFLPGDVNNNGHVNGADLVYLVGYIKGNISSLIKPLGRNDLNSDCLINLTDVTFMVNYFKGFGPAPEPGWCKDDLDQ
jgi:hypothetical protein